MLTPQVTCYWIANPDLLDSEFLCWLMRGEPFQRQLQAIAARKCIAEQNVIVLRLRTANEVIDSEEQELQKFLNLKSGLMTDLLTGRVRVPEGLAVAS